MFGRMLVLTILSISVVFVSSVNSISSAAEKRPIVQSQRIIKPLPATPRPMSRLRSAKVSTTDKYCGPGSGPGGSVTCDQAFITSCNKGGGTYHAPGELGGKQTWGTCIEPTG